MPEAPSPLNIHVNAVACHSIMIQMCAVTVTVTDYESGFDFGNVAAACRYDESLLSSSAK